MRKHVFAIRIILFFAGAGLFYPANAQHVPAVQWHFDGSKVTPILSSGFGYTDWVYQALPTDNKEYICAGYSNLNPVIFKLNKLGQLIWVKHFPHYGTFLQIVKTPNGYAAGGFGPNKTVQIAEVDEAGTVLSNDYYSIPGAIVNSQGRCLTMDPSQQFYLLGGEYDRQMYLAKID